MDLSNVVAYAAARFGNSLVVKGKGKGVCQDTHVTWVPILPKSFISLQFGQAIATHDKGQKSKEESQDFSKVTIDFGS